MRLKDLFRSADNFNELIDAYIMEKNKMTPPNPLTIEWLRENAKIGETVLVDPEDDSEFKILCVGATTVYAGTPSGYEVIIRKELRNLVIKQPEPAKKPKACAFINRDGFIQLTTLPNENEGFLGASGYSRAPEYDIEARE